LSEESIKEEGFEIFKNGTIGRLSPTHYVVKAQSANGWNLVELKDGVWTCDCNPTGKVCVHVCSTSYIGTQQRRKTKSSMNHTSSVGIVPRLT
jgi:hypothetical protein